MGCEVTDEGGEDLAQKSPQPPEDEAEVVAGAAIEKDIGLGEIGLGLWTRQRQPFE